MYEDFDVLEQRVRHMVEQHTLPSDITGFDVQFGETRDGDPTVSVRLHVATDGHYTPAEAREHADTILMLSKEVRQIVPGRSARTTIILVPDAAA